jgi:MoaA/NifB/PqqE/SkfB family radical SAM enzyme
MLFETSVLLRKYLPDELYRFLEFFYTYVVNALIIIKYRILSGIYLNKDNKKLYPSQLVLAPTTRCNLNCAICDRTNVVPVDLTVEKLRKIEKVIENVSDINLTGFGESLLNKNFPDILKYIFSINKSPRIMTMVTNGTLLNREFGLLVNNRISAIDISINAATPETYKRDMKNAELTKVLENVRDFMSVLDSESRNRVSLIFVAHARNYREMPAFIDLVNDMGIKRVRISHFVAHDLESVPLSLLNVKADYNHYLHLAIKRAIRHQIFLYDKKFNAMANCNYPKWICLSPLTQLVIQDPDGSVNGPCCCGEFRSVNVFETDFERFWFGEVYKRLRKSRYLPCCKKCRAFTSFDSLYAHFDHQFFDKNRDEIIKIINREQ